MSRSRRSTGYLEFKPVQVPYAIDERSVFSWQVACIGKLSGRLMTVFLKVFEKIVQRGVLMMIRRRAVDDLFVKKPEVIVGIGWIRFRD